MLKQHKLGLIATILLAISSFSASAGLITQYSSVGTWQRNCPGLSDPNYIANWGPAIEAFYGLSPGELSADLACHFNGGNQLKFYNLDGTRKNLDWDLPDGVPFTEEEAGGFEVIGETGTDYASISAEDGSFYAEVILDGDNLGLPQIKASSESDEFERNSVNGIAATEYLWTGVDTTLEYTVDFDFFASGEDWNLNGAADFYDYIFILEFGASTDMEFTEGSLFPSNWGNSIAVDGYSTLNDPEFGSSAEEPYESSLTVSFDVQTGDRFFLYGFVQAFGLNGGFTDAAHTVTSQLAIEGSTAEESLVIFEQSLQAAPPTDLTDIPEPSTFLLSFLGMVALLRKRLR